MVTKSDLEGHIQVLEQLIDNQHDQLAELLEPIVDSLESIIAQIDVDQLTQKKTVGLTDQERKVIERQAGWLARAAQQAGDIHSADLLLQDAATLRGITDNLSR